MDGEAVESLLAAAEAAADDAPQAIDIATTFGGCLPLPASGQTAERWQVLKALGARDLTVARVFEAHADALAILAEAGSFAAPGSWGVFAAEAPSARLDARETTDGWRLWGTKPWCSLGGELDHALITAHTPAGRRLFAVDLHGHGVRAEASTGWVARGLRTVVSVPVHFQDTPAAPVGAAGWYLSRPGFAWGGIGVSACWLGGAQAVADTVRSWTARRGADDKIALMHLGAVDVALWAADHALAEAGRVIDDGSARNPEVLALRARTVVADAVETTLRHAGHGLGPAPLAFDPAHARRVADLELYVRQHHAEADLAALGGLLIADERA